MFSKRRAFSGSRHWNRDFAEKFATDLAQAGFSIIVIKLPHNLVGTGPNEIPFREFVDRGRNYPSLILEARNDSRNETIKVLFVNISRKAFFLDNTFPSGHSEPSELYVESPDPARTYALFQFFYEYLQRSSRSLGFVQFALAMLSAVFLSAECLSLVGKRSALLSLQGKQAWIADVVGIGFAVGILYRYFNLPQGLYVKDRGTGLRKYINLAAKGELRDNPVVSIAVSVVAAVVTAVLMKVLHLP